MKLSILRIWLGIVAVVLLLTKSGIAAPFDLVKTYYGSNQSWGYGWSIAPIGNNKILTGSIQDNTAGFATGAAYVMDATSGAILSTIPNPNPNRAAYDNFGQAVTSVGNNILVGANWANHVSGPTNSYPGAAYLFDGTSGSLIRTFNPPSTGGYISYGSAVASVGGNILIGQESAPSTGDVTAYLYDSADGSLIRTIPNIGYRASFTASNSYLAVEGTNVLVGTPGNNNGVGAASLIDTTNGSVLRTFSDPLVTIQDNFGFAVALLPGNRFAISAPWADRGATNTGAVYIFDGTNGALLQTLLNPNPSNDDNFGISLAAVGNYLLVGAPYEDVAGYNDGAAYVFSIDTGALLHTFYNPSPQDSDWFGKSVRAIGNDFLISAPEDNTIASQAGAIYRFEGIPEPSSFALAVAALLATLGIARARPRRR